jgi:hypothetical protein
MSASVNNKYVSELADRDDYASESIYSSSFDNV